MKTDVIEKIKHIETTYPVENIEYAGIKLWPFFRNSIFTLYYYSDQDVTTPVVNKHSKIKRGFKALKLTSLSAMFKKDAAIIFTDDVGMKKHNGMYIDRIMQVFFDLETRSLPIIIKLFPDNVISVAKYVHSDFIAAIIMAFSFFFPIKQRKLVGVSVLQNIIDDLSIEFAYRKNIKLIIAALKFYNIYFAVIRPSKIYIDCYYDILRMPAYYIAKKRHIPTIEMQHGVINDQHIAYTSFKSFDSNPYPDYLLVFGDRFKLDVSENIYRKDSVFAVGSYYIDLMRQEADTNKRLFDKKYGSLKARLIITVASQSDMDKEILTFVEQVAKLDSRLFFIFIPRFVKDYHRSYKNDNITIETELDVYQCMQNSYVTSAVLSTCAIESLAFGTPVVLMDIDGVARFMYGSFFEGIQSVLYASRPDEFIEKVNKAVHFDRNVVQEEGNLFFVDNHKKRLKQALSDIESNYANK